jgi:hypothetical protein
MEPFFPENDFHQVLSLASKLQDKHMNHLERLPVP